MVAVVTAASPDGPGLIANLKKSVKTFPGQFNINILSNFVSFSYNIIRILKRTHYRSF